MNAADNVVTTVTEIAKGENVSGKGPYHSDDLTMSQLDEQRKTIQPAYIDNG